MFYTDNKDLVVENNKGLLATPTELEMQQWRQKGPLDKLHNIVVYIQQSTQRLANFRNLSSGHNLVQDNSTH